MWLLFAGCASAPPVGVDAPHVARAVVDTGAAPGVEACGGGDEDGDGVVDEDGALGCADDWRDADGDGLGTGEPACRCAPVGAAAGGDCDDQNGWRTVDCTEGAEVPLAGDRVLHDHPDGYVNLIAAGVFSTGGAELLFLGPGDSLVVAHAPAPGAGDVRLSDLDPVDVPFTNGVTLPILGDVDDDGWVDAVAVGGTSEPLEDDASRLSLELGVLAGPLGDPAPSSAVYTFPSVVTTAGIGALSILVDDLDGDALPELTVALGTTAATTGETAIWRAAADGSVTPLVAASSGFGVDTLVAAVGDLDGDGFAELGRYDAPVGVGATGTLRVFAGPLVELPPPAAATATWSTLALDAVQALGDLDGDGLGEVCLREERLWLIGGLASGALEDLALGVVGAETDAPGESALYATALDLGEPALVVSDTWWPAAHGAGNLRGALYLFSTVPRGVVDVRAADERRYGEGYGAFGAWPGVSGDGRVVAGANLLGTDVGTGVTWLVVP